MNRTVESKSLPYEKSILEFSKLCNLNDTQAILNKLSMSCDWKID